MRRAGRVLVSLTPWTWLLLFFFLPFLIVLKISLAEPRFGIPPYTPLIQAGRIHLDWGNFTGLLEDPLYLKAYLNSLRIAAQATFCCLLMGVPMAYAIARARPVWRGRLLMMVILPFWTSFLLRVYAWIGILKDEGLANGLLLKLGLITRPLPMLHSEFAVMVGIVYSYLPFMIMPLYATFEKLDLSLLEAAADLGCRPVKSFFAVTLPVSAPGLVAGAMLVFIPAVGEFVIPDLLGGPDTLMIGHVLWDEFFMNRDWPVAAGVAVAMLAFLVLPMAVLQHFQQKREEAAR